MIHAESALSLACVFQVEPRAMQAFLALSKSLAEFSLE